MLEKNTDKKFTTDHEWASLKEDVVEVGITDYAQQALGDIVFIELPSIGQHLIAGESFGVVESIKSVSDLFSPVSGEVVGVNEELTAAPEKINQAPYQSWFIKIKIDPKGRQQYEELLSEESYLKTLI